MQLRPCFLTILVLGFAVSISGQRCLADLTYTTTPFTFQGNIPGWSYAGGTITTNGTFVEINKDNVVDVIIGWDLSFTTPAFGGTTYTVTEMNSDLSYSDVDGSPNLATTATAISFPAELTPPPSPFADGIVFSIPGVNRAVAYFGQANNDRPAVVLFDQDAEATTAFSDQLVSPGVGSTIATISIVPEPTGLLFASIATVLACCRRIR